MFRSVRSRPTTECFGGILGLASRRLTLLHRPSSLRSFRIETPRWRTVNLACLRTSQESPSRPTRTTSWSAFRTRTNLTRIRGASTTRRSSQASRTPRLGIAFGQALAPSSGLTNSSTGFSVRSISPPTTMAKLVCGKPSRPTARTTDARLHGMQSFAASRPTSPAKRKRFDTRTCSPQNSQAWLTWQFFGPGRIVENSSVS